MNHQQLLHIIDKYNDLFVKQNKINPSIQNNILFIDIGYTKSSFIVSNYKYKEFKLEFVDGIENIGGQNFDYLIYEYCINEFKKQNKNNQINDKMKFKLLEVIPKSRQ